MKFGEKGPIAAGLFTLSGNDKISESSNLIP